MEPSRLEKLNREEREKAERKNKIYQDTIHALQTEERFVNYFKNYNAKSVEGFIKFYAQKKANWYEHADSFEHLRLHKENKWRHAAVNGLYEIMLKKMFNLKCRWVAGEMDLPGIEIGSDFAYWRGNPELQQAAGVITAEEMDCYLAYRQMRFDSGTGTLNYNKEFDEPSCTMTLSHYHWMPPLSIDGEKEEMPKWFELYDEHFGTGYLLDLPLTRAELECDYHDIWSEQIFKKTLNEEQLKYRSHLNRKEREELRDNPEKLKAHREEQNRLFYEWEAQRPKYEYMSTYEHDKMNELVRLIETKETQQLYTAYREWILRGRYDDMIQSQLYTLKEAKENIPIQSHDDYREAINHAHYEYHEKKVRETLSYVFEEYLQAVNAGQPFNWKTSGYGFGSEMSNVEIKARFLAARKWKGEAENLDFLKKENLPGAL